MPTDDERRRRRVTTEEIEPPNRPDATAGSPYLAGDGCSCNPNTGPCLGHWRDLSPEEREQWVPRYRRRRREGRTDAQA